MVSDNNLKSNKFRLTKSKINSASVQNGNNRNATTEKNKRLHDKNMIGTIKSLQDMARMD